MILMTSEGAKEDWRSRYDAAVNPKGCNMAVSAAFSRAAE